MLSSPASLPPNRKDKKKDSIKFVLSDACLLTTVNLRILANGLNLTTGWAQSPTPYCYFLITFERRQFSVWNVVTFPKIYFGTMTTKVIKNARCHEKDRFLATPGLILATQIGLYIDPVLCYLKGQTYNRRFKLRYL